MSYQNPLDFQMSSLSKVDEEEELATTTTDLTKAQPVSTGAKSILAQEGITSARDILRTQPGGGAPITAKGVLKTGYSGTPADLTGSTEISARGIVEQYRQEAEAQRKQEFQQSQVMKVESALRKKEEEYIKSMTVGSLQYNPFDFKGTKFGDLDLKEAKKYTGYGFPDYRKTDGSVAYFTYEFTLGDTPRRLGSDYTFLPEEFALRGNGNDFNAGFLDKKTWEEMIKIAQPIDMSGAGNVNFDTGRSNVPTSVSMGRGFLFKSDEFDKFKKEYLDGKFYKLPPTGAVQDQPILGIAELNGELVYVRQPTATRTKTYHTIYTKPDGVTQWYYDKKGFASDITKAFASVPFASEAIFLATGNPYLYASLKGLETAGKGGDLGDWAKSAATAFISSTATQALQPVTSSISTGLQNAGVSAAVANTASSALVNAGLSGTMAALTGGDVGDAMLSGAISGGLGANAAEITNTVFGSNAATIASTINLTEKQFQQLFTGSLAAGTINAAVYNKDFLDAFKESLIVNGVSQSGANAVASRLDKELSPKAKAAIVGNTRIMLQATARAAVRGEDINKALSYVAPYMVARVSGQTVDILTSKK